MLSGCVRALYCGAMRNSFHDTLTAYTLNSSFLSSCFRTCHIPHHYLPRLIEPKRAFVLGCISGMTKVVVYSAVTMFDKKYMSLQTKFPLFFHVMILAAAFFSACCVARFFASKSPYFAFSKRSFWIVESGDLLYQALTRQIAPQQSNTKRWQQIPQKQHQEGF